MKRTKLLTYISIATVTGVFMASCCFIPQNPEKLDLSKMELVWEENFEGTSLDTDSWYFYEGEAANESTPTSIDENTNVITGPIFNNERQNYRKTNVSVGPASDDTSENGYSLKLTATSKDGITWDSGKIQSSNKVDIKYGYIEARLRMPVAYDASDNEIENKGVWPAFWMMPTASVYGTWPRSGEIDIMEYSPSTSGNKAYATLHHASSKTDATDVYPSLGSVMIEDNEYHTFGVRWTSGIIEAFVDGVSLGTVYANPGYENWALWPYDQEFYVILNLAMGGNLGGPIEGSMRKAVYEVDYVRYYK